MMATRKTQKMSSGETVVVPQEHIFTNPQHEMIGTKIDEKALHEFIDIQIENIDLTI